MPSGIGLKIPSQRARIKLELLNDPIRKIRSAALLHENHALLKKFYIEIDYSKQHNLSDLHMAHTVQSMVAGAHM